METASLGRDQSAITIINCLSEYIVSVKILEARPVVIESEFFISVLMSVKNLTYRPLELCCEVV